MNAQRPSDYVRARDGFIALTYFLLFWAYLFRHRESELGHWLSMVLIPFAISYLALPARSVRSAFASLGIQRGRLGRGVAWALLLGAGITLFQVFFGGRAAAIQQLIRSGRAVWLFPLAALLMLLMAGLTEEVLFRGFLQTRLEKLMRSRWAAMLLATLLFGVYHVPYAYYVSQWPSHGDWPLAWRYALSDGLTGGLLLGTVYVVSGGNLIACVVLHALIDAAPVMTMIHFGR